MSSNTFGEINTRNGSIHGHRSGLCWTNINNQTITQATVHKGNSMMQPIIAFANPAIHWEFEFQFIINFYSAPLVIKFEGALQ